MPDQLPVAGRLAPVSFHIHASQHPAEVCTVAWARCPVPCRPGLITHHKALCSDRVTSLSGAAGWGDDIGPAGEAEDLPVLSRSGFIAIGITEAY